MKYLSFLFIATIAISLLSCATILNDQNVTVDIFTDPPGAQVKINDSLIATNTPASIYLPRSSNPVYLTLIKDSLKRNVFLDSKNCSAFWYGNFLFGPLSLVGYIVDIAGTKRYTYDNEIYVDMNENSESYSSWFPEKCRSLKFIFSIPYVNRLAMEKQSGFGYRSGFFGLSCGMEYYVDTNEYISVQAATSTDVPIPFPAAIDFIEPYERYFSDFVNAKYNIILDRFHIGAGIHYSVNSWFLFNETLHGSGSARKYNHCMGISLSAYYQLFETFFAGVVFQPGFIDLDNSFSMSKQFYLGIDLAWKLKILNLE